MFRKIWVAGIALFAITFLTVESYKISLLVPVNGWFIEQQNVADQLGDKAPWQAKAANRFSRLPIELSDLLSIGRVEAQTAPGTVIDRGVFRGHVSVAQTTRPSISGATVTSGSTDYRGRFTVPTAATVTITFGTAFISAPWCDVTRSDGSSTTGHAWTVSTIALTITSVTFGASNIYNWRCDGVMP